jgi:N utilization substance protein B
MMAARAARSVARTGARHKAREAALKILFSMDLTGAPLREATANYWNRFDPEATYSRFANSIVRGVIANLQGIDAAISKASTSWRIERMTFVERNVLRIGAYEILYATNAPPIPVILNEAIELGKRFGSERSGAFINGVLDRIAS